MLLLDAGVRLARTALAFVGGELEAHGERVWNGHAFTCDATGIPYGGFWNVLVALALATTSPSRARRGSTPRLRPLPEGNDLLPRAARLCWRRRDAFRSDATPTCGIANDDTPVIRGSPSASAIHLSPAFALHVHAGGLAARLREARAPPRRRLPRRARARESRFFPAVVAFYPVSAALAVAALRRPGRVPRRGARRRGGGRGGRGRARAGRGSRSSRSARSRRSMRSPTGPGCGGARARARRLGGGGRDPRGLRDDRGADQARAGARPAARRAATATCSRRPGSRCSRSRRFLDAFGLPQPDLWLARGAGGRDLRDEPGHPRLARPRVAAFARAPRLAAARAPRRARARRSCSSTATR